MANSREEEMFYGKSGWRSQPMLRSLSEVHRTLVVPHPARFYRKLLAFAGPGFLVAVGYMDPGNWATDLAGGSKFNYTLLSVIMISNFMAILLQSLSLKLGIATGRDLAQACRDHYSRPVSFCLWIICEIAIAACDLAEVIGSAIALELLFGIPLTWGIAITSLDVLIVLYLQHRGFRLLEALVLVLIATIAGCFLFEILISKPDTGAVLSGFVPSASILRDPDKLYIAIGILGATVMPHNLYLHSSVVQTRSYEETRAGTLAGQIVMEGFLNIGIRPWLRRLITRLIAIVPAALTAIFFGAHGTAQLLILSQVILSLQLSFAVFPLVRFTSDRMKMGEFVNPVWLKVLAYVVAVSIAAFNAWLLVRIFSGWMARCIHAFSCRSRTARLTSASSSMSPISRSYAGRKCSCCTSPTGGRRATWSSSTFGSRRK